MVRPSGSNSILFAQIDDFVLFMSISLHFIYFLNFTATAVEHLPLFLLVYLSTPLLPLDSLPPYLSLQEKLSDSQLYTPGTSSSSGYKMKGQCPLSFKYYSQGF